MTQYLLILGPLLSLVAAQYAPSLTENRISSRYFPSLEELPETSITFNQPLSRDGANLSKAQEDHQTFDGASNSDSEANFELKPQSTIQNNLLRINKLPKELQTSEGKEKLNREFKEIEQTTRNVANSQALTRELDVVDGNNENISKNLDEDEDVEDGQQDCDEENEKPDSSPYQSSSTTRIRPIKNCKNSTPKRNSPQETNEPWVFPVGKFGRVVGAAPIPISNINRQRNLHSRRKEKSQIDHRIRSTKGRSPGRYFSDPMSMGTGLGPYGSMGGMGMYGSPYGNLGMNGMGMPPPGLGGMGAFPLSSSFGGYGMGGMNGLSPYGSSLNGGGMGLMGNGIGLGLGTGGLGTGLSPYGLKRK